MRFYILAGEASGDVHAAGLIRAIRRHCPEAEFRGMGGDACRSEGMVLHRHFSEQNYMGFAEILRHLPQIFRNIRETVADIAAYRPGVVIPVDYPGFNFRVMRQVWAMGIPVDYFIPPQIWAWRPGRAKTLARYTRHRLVVFPFEPDFYRSYWVEVKAKRFPGAFARQSAAGSGAYFAHHGAGGLAARSAGGGLRYAAFARFGVRSCAASGHSAGVQSNEGNAERRRYGLGGFGHGHP